MSSVLGPFSLLNPRSFPGPQSSVLGPQSSVLSPAVLHLGLKWCLSAPVNLVRLSVCTPTAAQHVLSPHLWKSNDLCSAEL